MSAKSGAATPLCVGIGEVLWDLLPGGRTLGGAPVNVAAHVAQLGLAAAAVSGVGDDPEGREVLERLEAMGVLSSCVRTVPGLPTGLVDVVIDAQGVPKFTIRAPAAWDSIPFDDEVACLASKADAVVFGSLAQRGKCSRATVDRFLGAVRPGCLKVCDVNLRPPFIDAGIIRASLEKADVLKLNDVELPVLSDMFGLAGDESGRLRALRDRFELDLVVLTRGAQGSRMIAGPANESHGGFPAQVVDTVGAGDAFTAAVIAGWLRGMALTRLQDMANRVAAFVCSRSGAVPKLPAELVSEFKA